MVWVGIGKQQVNKIFKMLEQFQNILDEPNYTQQQLLQSTRNLILNSLETNFPADFNFDGLAALCNDPKIASNEALLTYHLVDYFIQLMHANFVSTFNYESLQSQTQKLQSTIRSHIRLEQEVKMYLEHLEYKLLKYENYLQHLQKEPMYQSTDSIPSQQQTQLRKQKVSLVRNNQLLKRQLKEKQHQLEQRINQIARLKHLKTDSVQSSAQILKRSLRLVNAKSERRLQPLSKLSNSGQKQLKVEKTAQASKQESQALLINISGNNNEVNYYAGSTL